jgi:Tfp pilus assembly protein PilF
VHKSDIKASTSYLEAACEKYEKAQLIFPDDFEILFNWGNAILGNAYPLTPMLIFLAQARLYTHEPNVYIEKLQSACDKYSKAYQLKSDSYEILRNWAASLSKLARYLFFLFIFLIFQCF